jgi:proline iminopeptidase
VTTLKAVLTVPAFVAGLTAPPLTVVLAGQVTESTIAMGASAVLGTGFAVVLTAAMLYASPIRRRLGSPVVPCLAVALGAVLSLVALLPPGSSPPAKTVAGQQFSQLSTGSRIAFVRVPARGPGDRAHAPVVYLHGGPGVSEMPEAVATFGRLAETGRDVYVYDQLGAGRSGRLSDPRRYTTDRALADLEAIRRHIGAPRMALIGHSWGSTLAAAYIARHPRRVERVVFSSPGSIVSDGEADGSPLSRLSAARKIRIYARAARPRSLVGYALTVTRPTAAHRFAGDAEMDRRFRALFARSRPGLLCESHLANRISADGVGHYAFQLTDKHGPRVDPRPQLRSNPIPALVLRGACDYLPERLAGDYVRTLPHARLVELPDAGHQTYVEQPQTVLVILERFLDGDRAGPLKR